MKKLLLGVLMGAAMMSAPASAATIMFSYSASSINDVFLGSDRLSGSGSFTTSADSGTFTLKGLNGFSASGYSGGLLGGNYSLGLQDLVSFSATLVNGSVTGLNLQTGDFATANDFLGFFTTGLPESTNSFSVTGLDSSNFTVNRDNVFFTGNFTIDAPVVIPGGPGGGGPGSGGPVPGAGAVPEPATWAMMIGGIGLTGGVLRRRGRKAVPAIA